MTIRATKALVRHQTFDRIRALDPWDRDRRQEPGLDAQFPALPGFAVAGTVLLYVSAFPEEVNTRPWLDLALKQGKRLVCPRVTADRQTLELCVITDPATDLVAGFRSIPEPGPACPVVPPEAIDWALIPGVAFDRQGYRLGRGAGHYDRLLPTLRPGVPCFALILDAQWVDAIPREAHDQPLTGVADAEGLVLSPRANLVSES